MFRLFRLLRPYGWRIALVTVLVDVSRSPSFICPPQCGHHQQGIARGIRITSAQRRWMFLLFRCACPCFGAGYILFRFYFDVIRPDMRARLFRHVESFSQAELDRFGAPSLITRCTNDVQQVQMLVHTGLTMMMSAPIMMIGGVIMALRQDRQLSLLIAVVIPVMLVAIGLVLRHALPLFKTMQARIDRVNLVIGKS